MRLTPTRRLLTYVAALLALAGIATFGVPSSGAAGAATAPHHKASPSIAIKPSTNLRNKEKVAITGKNFPKKTSLVIVECNPKVLKDNPSACDADHLVTVTTTSKGTVAKKSFVVLTGTIGNGKCGTSSSTLKCYIFVSEPSVTSKVHADGVIKFAKP